LIYLLLFLSLARRWRRSRKMERDDMVTTLSHQPRRDGFMIRRENKSAGRASLQTSTKEKQETVSATSERTFDKRACPVTNLTKRNSAHREPALVG